MPTCCTAGNAFVASEHIQRAFGSFSSLAQLHLTSTCVTLGRQCKQPALRCGSRPGWPSSSSTQCTHTPCWKHGGAKLPACLRAPHPPCTKEVPRTPGLALPCGPHFLPEAHLRPEAEPCQSHARRPPGAGGAGQRAAARCQNPAHSHSGQKSQTAPSAPGKVRRPSPAIST